MHSLVLVKGVGVLLRIVQCNVLVHGHGLILARDIPAQHILLEPLDEGKEVGGDALKCLLGGTHQQKQLHLAAPVK